LSLTFATAAALACPGGGGESETTFLSLSPSSFTFEAGTRSAVFTVTYTSGTTSERVFKHFAFSSRYQIKPVERDGCREVTLIRGQECRFVVEWIESATERRGRLSAELTHSTAQTAELISP
jgi:hypothetical protein